MYFYECEVVIKGLITQVYIFITGAKDCPPDHGRAHTQELLNLLNDFIFFKIPLPRIICSII